MGKKEIPQMPDIPEYYQDEFLGGDRGLFSEAGRGLTSGDYSFNDRLEQLVNPDPQMTDLALSYAKGTLTPEFNRQRQSSINELASLGALESSTTSNAFALQDENLMSQFQAITAGAALDDRSRARQNEMDLFGTGLNTLSQSIDQGFVETQIRNQFNQQYFENQWAKNINDSRKTPNTFLNVASLFSPMTSSILQGQGYEGVWGNSMQDIMGMVGGQSSNRVSGNPQISNASGSIYSSGGGNLASWGGQGLGSSNAMSSYMGSNYGGTQQYANTGYSGQQPSYMTSAGQTAGALEDKKGSGKLGSLLALFL